MRITSYHLSPVSLKCPLPVTLAHSCLAWTLGLGLGSGNRTEVLSTFWCFLLANTCRHQSYFMDEETEARLPPPWTALALSRKSAFLSFKNSSFLMGGEKKRKKRNKSYISDRGHRFPPCVMVGHTPPWEMRRCRVTAPARLPVTCTLQQGSVVGRIDLC